MGFWKRIRNVVTATFRGRKGTYAAAARGVEDLPQIPRTFDALCARVQPKAGRVVDVMHWIISSAIGTILATVGVYHIALLTGASDPVAFIVAFAFAVAVAVAAAFAAAVVAVPAVVAAVPAVAAAVVGVVTVTSAATFAAAAVVVAVACVASAGKQLRIGWPLAAYAIEALTIMGALTIGGVGGSIAVALAGIGSLFVLHRMERRTRIRTTATAQDAHLSDRVAEFLSGALTEERNRFLGDGSVFQEIARRVARARENAERIREQVGARIMRTNEDGQQSRAYLATASEAAQDLCVRLDANRDQLEACRSRVDAFFADCTAHVARIAEPLHDRALLLELDALLEESHPLDREVREVVEGETTALTHRIAGLRDHLLRLAGDARVQAALAIPERGGMGDIEVFEDALRAFDEADE